MEKSSLQKPQQASLSQKENQLIQSVISYNTPKKAYNGTWVVSLMDKTELNISESQAMSLMGMLEQAKFVCINGVMAASHQITTIKPVYETRLLNKQKEEEINKLFALSREERIKLIKQNYHEPSHD